MSSKVETSLAITIHGGAAEKLEIPRLRSGDTTGEAGQTSRDATVCAMCDWEGNGFPHRFCTR